MSSGKVKKAAAIVMAGMIISRILGYVRYKVIFYYFGRGMETDAFFGAFLVPDMLYYLASGGAMSAAFIPVFTELIEKKRESDAWAVMSAIVNITIIAVGFFVGLGMVFAPQLAAVIVPGFVDDKETFDLCVVIVRIIFPMVMLTALSAICNGVLQSRDHFVAPSVAWVLHNLGIISAAFLFHDVLGIKGLGYGVVAGATGMVLVQLPVMFKKGMKFNFTLGIGNADVKRVLKLFLPAMFGLAISQINMLTLPMTFGSFMSEGAVSALQGGVRLLLLPIGIFGNAISMAIFPTLSRHAGAGRMDEFRSTLVRGVNSTFVFSMPSMVGLIILGVPMTRVLFGGGAFNREDCEATALALLYFSIGLPGHTAVQVIARGYYSLKDTRTPLYVGLVSVFLISIPFSIGIIEPYITGQVLENMQPLIAMCKVSPFYYLALTDAMRETRFGGMALSVSMATLFNAVALLLLFKKRMPEMEMSRIWISLARLSAASAVMAAGCLGVMRVTAAGDVDPLVQLGAGGLVGCLLFIGTAKVFRVAELDEAIAMVKRRFGKK